jgi:hypothetical protein
MNFIDAYSYASYWEILRILDNLRIVRFAFYSITLCVLDTVHKFDYSFVGVFTPSLVSLPL